MGERHVRIEISDFVMRTFVLYFGNIDKSSLQYAGYEREGARRNHSACFGRVLQSFFLKNSGLGL